MNRIFTVTMLLMYLASMLIGGKLQAQSAPGLTLEQCLTLAKQNSLKLQITAHELQKTDLARSELRAAGKPHISAKAGASYAPDSRTFGYDPAITDGGQLNGQLAVEQPIYDGGIRRLQRTQLALELEQLKLELRLTERDLLADTKQRFVEVLRAERELGVQEESVNQLQSYYDLVRSMNQGGAVARTDVLKTQVDLSNAQVALEKAHNARLNGVLALALDIGLPPDTSLTVVGSLDTLLSRYADLLETTLGGYPAQAPELQNAIFDVQRSELDEDIARREHRPAVDLTADAGYLSSRDNLTVPGRERYSGFGFSAGLNATLSLFNGGATKLRIQQAQLATQSLRLQQQLLERSLRNQAQNLRMQIRSAQQTLEMLHKNIETAENNYLLVRSTYAGGGTTATEVLMAQQAQRDAKLAELDAITNILQLRIQLEQTLTSYNGTQP